MPSKAWVWSIRIFSILLIIFGFIIAFLIPSSALRKLYTVNTNLTISLKIETSAILINKTGMYLIKSPSEGSSLGSGNLNRSATLQQSTFLIATQEAKIMLLGQLLLVLGIFTPFSLFTLDKVEQNSHNGKMLLFGLLSFSVTIIDILLIFAFLGLAIYGQQEIPHEVFPWIIFILVLGPAFSLLSFAEKLDSYNIKDTEP